MSERARATLIGFVAILLWSSLALMTAASGNLPPFQLAALTFAIGGAIGAVTWPFRPAARAALRQPPEVWALGVGGLFGYHALYFIALKSAPPAEAGLISYLWPLLIVLLSSLLPGERLRLHHVCGALMGLAGTIVLFSGGESFSIESEYVPGFAAAFVAAFVWAIYSVLSRRFAKVSTDVVAAFCLCTAALSTLFHLALEETVWPAGMHEWLAVILLGLGPVGAAFYAWDFAVKRGDISVLGAGSYLAPVLSTLFLVVSGFARPSVALEVAAALITCGGLLAAKEMLLRTQSAEHGAGSQDA